MGGPFTRNSERELKSGSGNGASLFRGTWRGCSFAEGPKGYERKALGMGISLNGGSVGQPGVLLSTGDFEMWLKGALEVECLSLWELYEGNLEGGLPCWAPEDR